MTDEMIDCNCQDCDGGCDMVSAPELEDEDGEPLCFECSVGSHRQDRDEEE